MVLVEFEAVKFWRVVEEFTRSEPLPIPEVRARSELKAKRSFVASQVRSALGVRVPRSKATYPSSVSAEALSEFMVRVSAVRLPPVRVPTRVVAFTSSA